MESFVFHVSDPVAAHLLLLYAFSCFFPQRVGAGRLVFLLSSYAGIAIIVLKGWEAWIALVLGIIPSLILPFRFERSSRKYLQREDFSSWFHRGVSLVINVGSQLAGILVSQLLVVALLGFKAPHEALAGGVSSQSIFVLLVYLIVFFHGQTGSSALLGWIADSCCKYLGLSRFFRLNLKLDLHHYGLALGVYGPLQLLGSLVYALDHIFLALVASAWAIYLHAFATLQANRRRSRLQTEIENRYLKHIARNQEKLAHVTHQTRHQLGLIGMSLNHLHRILKKDTVGHRDALREVETLAASREEIAAILSHPHVEQHRPEKLASLLRSQLRLLSGAARERGVQVQIVELASELESTVLQNGKALRQALYNLIENAVSAAEESVTLSVKKQKGKIAIVIENDSAGHGPNDWGPDDWDRLEAPGQTNKPGGTGMGITIAKAMLAELGGSLRFEPRLHGTRVICLVPVP